DWRSGVDSAAVVLIVLGFGVSAYHRPAHGRFTITQTGFVKWVAVPILAGSILLAASIAAWIPQMNGSAVELFRWVYFGMLVYVLARLAAAIWSLLHRDDVPPSHQLVFPLELLGWAVAGMCTGLLIGIGAQLCRTLAEPGVQDYELAKNLAIYGPPWIITSFLVGEAIYVGVTSRLPYGERDREWLGRAAGWFGIFGGAYLGFFWLVLSGWEWINQ